MARPPLRADARRNRERLIRAGAEVLVEDGPGATVAAIARRAELSEGSFFTYFASKHELMAALVAERNDALHAIALRSSRGDGTALERLERYIWDAAEDVAPHAAYLEAASHSGAFDDAARASARALDMVVGRLVVRAQHEGTLRDDVTVKDVHALVAIATLAAMPYLPGRPRLWRRFVALYLPGLRADASRRRLRSL